MYLYVTIPVIWYYIGLPRF